MDPEQQPPPPHVADVLAALQAAGRPAPERVQTYCAAPPGAGSVAPQDSMLCVAIRWPDDTAVLWNEVQGWRVASPRPAVGARTVVGVRVAPSTKPERVAQELLAELERL
ncbi:hypothetical protein [Streptomyces sp.]|uniref:hypothetical protein n=1 Tax=Streptomyces sp. TaxID=1931 RepID=UPI002F9226A8